MLLPAHPFFGINPFLRLKHKFSVTVSIRGKSSRGASSGKDGRRGKSVVLKKNSRAGGQSESKSGSKKEEKDDEDEECCDLILGSSTFSRAGHAGTS